MSSLPGCMLYAADALNVHSWGMAVAAHNLANMNTPDFLPQKAVLATGPGGQSVRLETVLGGPGSKSVLSDTAVSSETHGDFSGERPSGTDPAREFAGMIATQRAFEVNAVAVVETDTMYTALLDIKI